MSKDGIIRYYDYTIPFWKVFWHKGTNSIHYGFWDDNTKNLQESLINTNKTLADIAQIDPKAKVLDAGCGVGGSAIWLAKDVGCYVVGITLSTKQKEKAEKYAREAGVQNKTEFHVINYSDTRFSNETFDVVWALESVCYERDKSIFIKEAYRILKRGGKIVVADGFLKRVPRGERERSIFTRIF